MKDFINVVFVKELFIYRVSFGVDEGVKVKVEFLV